MKIATLFTLIALPLFSSASSALACGGGQQCFSYNWTQGGSCAEFASDGQTYIRPVPNNYCESTQGSVFNWTQGGSCAEFASDGQTYVRAASNYQCERSQGYVTNWTQGGSCAEFAADGQTYVMALDISRCEQSCGVLQYAR